MLIASSQHHQNLLVHCYVVKAVVRSDADVQVSEAKKGSGLRGKLNEVVLAYTGGLDTSVIVPWLRLTFW